MTAFTDHPYVHPDDFLEMWQLLAESNAQTGAPDNWTFARLENWRYASWDRSDEAFGRLAARARLLAAHGYEDRGPAEVMRAYDQTISRPPVALPPGYRLSDLATFTDAAAYCELERVAFRNDYIDLNWFRGKTAAPSYDPTLHVVALSPEGQPVAVAHGWTDAATGTAEIDPVATHPDHRRRHLAQAVVVEAFARLAARGVGVTWIGSGAEPNPSNRLYDSLQPSGKWISHRWVRESPERTAA